ncbi:MAG: UDP-N-acetylmuramoyl-L-alanyl-D-glutamate--2,6-diaminopimelate ligase [Clostridia bacterium]
MKLSILALAIDSKLPSNDFDIRYITDNSKKCTNNSIFVAHEKGKAYVSEAIENGAVLIVSNEKLCDNCVVVGDTRKAYAKLCRAFFGYADKKLKLIAVTGTNGKTSVATMLYTMLNLGGYKAGLMGTICNKIGDKSYKSSLTTLDCFELHQMFSELVENDATYCVLEASSQGLVQQRLYGLEFEIAIFTNLTIDHLDYHKTFENYKRAKLSLFENAKISILNSDDEHCEDFKAAAKQKVITYSVKNDLGDYTAKNVNYNNEQLMYEFVNNFLIHRIKLNLQGDFFVYNSMAAIIAALELGISLPECASMIKTINQIKGRFELLPINKPFQVIIDYAHTPDGLRQVLLSIRHYCKGRIITVFGCGGDRDSSKRAVMGNIASQLSDIVVVTSDNPRTEEPMSIINEILEGCTKPKKQLYIHENRTDAIKFALKTAKKNDIILLAGKGHEDYQILGTEKIHYDERQIVEKILLGSI